MGSPGGTFWFRKRKSEGVKLTLEQNLRNECGVETGRKVTIVSESLLQSIYSYNLCSKYAFPCLTTFYGSGYGYGTVPDKLGLGLGSGLGFQCG